MHIDECSRNEKILERTFYIIIVALKESQKFKKTNVNQCNPMRQRNSYGNEEQPIEEHEMRITSSIIIPFLVLQLDFISVISFWCRM